MQRHREQRRGDDLARVQQHVHLARRRGFAMIARQLDQLVGLVAHRGDHRDHAVARRARGSRCDRATSLDPVGARRPRSRRTSAQSGPCAPASLSARDRIVGAGASAACGSTRVPAELADARQRLGLRATSRIAPATSSSARSRTRRSSSRRRRGRRRARPPSRAAWKIGYIAREDASRAPAGAARPRWRRLEQVVAPLRDRGHEQRRAPDVVYGLVAREAVRAAPSRDSFGGHRELGDQQHQAEVVVRLDPACTTCSSSSATTTCSPPKHRGDGVVAVALELRASISSVSRSWGPGRRAGIEQAFAASSPPRAPPRRRPGRGRPGCRRS